MSRKALGIVLIGVGGVLVVVAVALALWDPADGGLATGSTSTTAAGPATTLVTPTTSLLTPTTATPAASTTAPVAQEGIAEFVEAFAAALAAGDQGFVMERLHPAVIAGYTLETCQTWVSTEVMALSDYGLTGDPTGPVDKSLVIAGETVTIDDVYTAPVGFTFSGQSFDSVADFAVVDGLVRWLGTCE